MNSVGSMCEGTGTNIFAVINQQVVTPPLSTGCLAGITRELLLEWGLASERKVSLAELESADEVFLTSSTRDVHPVTKLGEREWALPGEITKALSARFVRRIVQDVDP